MPDEVRAAASRLRATTVTYVCVGARGENRQPWHWIYLPEPEFKTYRIGSPSAVYAPLAPPDTASFYVEYSHHGELSRAQCEQHAVEDLVRSQMIHSAEELLFARARGDPPRVCALRRRVRARRRRRSSASWSTRGILTAGRYGQWEYSSMEDAILGGRASARALNER